MEQLHPETNLTPVNAIEIKMPDGTSLDVHAPGAPDVLTKQGFDFVAKVGDPLEPLGQGLDEKPAIIREGESILGGDSIQEPVPTYYPPEFDVLPEKRETVLASGIAVRGLGNAVRGWRARRLDRRALELDTIAEEYEEAAQSEKAHIEYRQDTVSAVHPLVKGPKAERFLGGVPEFEYEIEEDDDGNPIKAGGRFVLKRDSDGNPIPVLDKYGNPKKFKVKNDTDLSGYGITVEDVREVDVAEQEYRNSIKRFHGAHMTRSTFSNGRGETITKTEFNRRQPLLLEQAKAQAEIRNIELAYEGKDIPLDLQTRIAELRTFVDQKQLELDNLPDGRSRPIEMGSVFGDSLDMADFADREGLGELTTRDPRDLEEAREIEEARAKYGEIQAEIANIHRLYGSRTMSSSALKELEELEHERDEIIKEFREKQAGVDKKSKKESSVVNRNEKAARKIRNKATKKRNKAARLRSRSS